MICKERLPRVACFSFIFISVLIFTPSFTFDNYTGAEDEEDDCIPIEEYSATVFLKNSSEVVTFCCPIDSKCESRHHLPSTLHDFNFEKITCIMNMTNHLRCFWNITNLPKNAEHSAVLTYENSHQILSCFQIVGKEAVECHGYVLGEAENKLKVNISLPTLSYRIGKMFGKDEIVKPDPPDNIGIYIDRTKIEINWTHSEEKQFSKNPICYKYELKINDEVVTLADGQSCYIKQDVDVTKKYAIQVRVKQTESCGRSIHWSDWSSVHEVGPIENKYPVNPWVISVIAFVLPMLLLAVLLLCKFQRLPKKLFPPVPGPSVNVKNLLDKDNYIQDFSSRCVYHDSEVVHTVEERNG